MGLRVSGRKAWLLAAAVAALLGLRAAAWAFPRESPEARVRKAESRASMHRYVEHVLRTAVVDLQRAPDLFPDPEERPPGGP